MKKTELTYKAELERLELAETVARAFYGPYVVVSWENLDSEKRARWLRVVDVVFEREKKILYKNIVGGVKKRHVARVVGAAADLGPETKVLKKSIKKKVKDVEQQLKTMEEEL